VIRAVIDTNILASGFIRPDRSPGRILLAWRDQQFELYTSSYILAELHRTLNTNRYFASRLSESARRDNLRLILRLAVRVGLSLSVSGVASQAKDDPILATALNANADYLVTGDKALLTLRTFEGTRIVTAADFVAIIDAQ
jgi:uncharacterized protein